MIKFFRHIRQQLLKEGNTSKYFRYAIGEIFLVVIGILIALQINNWNEEKKEQAIIKEYAKSLIQDLEADIRMIDIIVYQSDTIVARIDSLGRYVTNKSIEDIENLKVFCFTFNKPHRPYIWNRTTMDELKNSGRLGFINDDTLAKKLSQYDAFTYHLDEDYNNDRAQFEKATHLTSLVVNNNYPNFDALHEKLVPKDNVRDYDFFSTQEYKEAKTYDLGLLSENINDVYQVVNSFNILKSYLLIRSEIELPKHVKAAEELIALLQQEYGDPNVSIAFESSGSK